MPTTIPTIHVVGAAILDGRTCLVAQRGGGGGGASKWEFPGGKVEPGETPRAALAREIREELRVEIEVGEWLGRGEHTDGVVAIELDVYAARIVSGDIRLAEHRRCGWFGAGQLDALDWAAADRPLLPALERLLASR
jgi:8-oxo-dGTP diphosphatase